MKATILRLLPVAVALLGACAPSPLSAGRLQQAEVLASTLHGQAQPMAVYVTGKGVTEPYGAAAGLAAPGQPLGVDTPLRIASNTKTFVAATTLRLWEQGRIDLDAPIGPLLTPALATLLEGDGYDTSRITVRHLLSHSAGLYDHGGDPRYIKDVLRRPDHVWTREEQVRLAMGYADPQSPPGTEFRYSDTGYILLGDIIERLTGDKLAAVVRREMRFDTLGLSSTWWEVVEPKPAGAAERARQKLGAIDATDVHASMDLFGGGGLVMSTRDLATVFAALFEGKIFERPETLKAMFWKGPHEGADQYRLGIFVKRIGDREVYWHSGFWGTLAYYAPDTGVAVAGVTTNQDAFRQGLLPIVETNAVSR